MKRFVALSLVALFLTTCRTAAPTGAPIAPLTATTADEAAQQLRARRASFAGARALMRVRATVKGKTQSFRAQLSVIDAQRMELIAYTPVGTTAMKMSANGEHVSIDNRIEGTQWEGNANELARSLGFFGTSLAPAEMSMLILGLPPRDDLTLDVTPSGLRSARVEDVSVTFDPPAFPAQHAVVTRGDDRVEIEIAEVVR
ncbi:MAG TPA: hypothetical protein VMU84_10310 [Thermoanaerobaculia bacterium]|nr:hypothetical protein [Thermoanaerobaculia bacterium]